MESIDRLLEIMRRLRDPETGCPWDRKQGFQTIAPYTLEEAYEVVDAIEREDYRELREELGDLLLQVVYHAQIASEKKLFDFGGVVDSIATKMIRRHPHVFGGLEAGDDAAGDDAELARRWDRDKEQARKRRRGGAFDGIAKNLPALHLAHKLQSRMAYKGLDWEKSSDVLEKLDEEVAELHTALERNDGIAEELGDLLFTLVNLCRHLSVGAEDALRKSNRKFEKRVGFIEEKLKTQGRDWESVSPEELEVLWKQAKSQ